MLAERLISPGERGRFGDNENDLSRIVGRHGYAVANAPEGVRGGASRPASDLDGGSRR